jgi:hypothetical protein
MLRNGTERYIDARKQEKAFAGTPLMVRRDGRRLSAIAGVQLKGDTKKSKSKSRLSSGAFGKKSGTLSSRLGVGHD